MTIRTGYLLCGAVLAFGCFACDEVDDDEVTDFGEGVVQARQAEWNSFKVNSFKVNSFKVNGFKVNTDSLPGASGTTDYIKTTEIRDPDWWTTTNVSLTGGKLKVGSYSGYNAELSEFKYEVKEGGTTTNKRVRVNYAYQIGSSDVWEYDLRLSLNNGMSWSHLCVDDNGNSIKSVILNGVWDSNGAKINQTGALTFACNDGALAKCVHFGYKPWATVNNTSLADYHQACVRMVRADYCGNGNAHTVSGTRVHVLDQIGIQNVDSDESYVVEAEWGPNGATCLNPDNTRLANQTIECSIPTCGSSFASGGLIQSGKIVQ